MISSWPRWLRSFSSWGVHFREDKSPDGGFAPRVFSVLIAIALGFSAFGCSPAPPILRQRGTTTELGRVIPPSAYAHFMAGLRAESAEANEEARALYMAALRADPQAGAAWGGLVRTTCSLPDDRVQVVLSAALRAADRPALPLVAFAQCKLRAQQASALRAAEQASRQALEHEPLLKQASWTLQASLTAQHKLTAARRVRDGYELYAGESFTPAASDGESQVSSPPLSGIDSDLLRGQIASAQDRAAGHLTWGELSVRALALGATRAALAMAAQVLVNDANDPNAQLVVALAERPLKLGGLTNLLQNQRTDVCGLGLVLLAIELKRTQSDTARPLIDESFLESVDAPDPLLQRWLREARR